MRRSIRLFVAETNHLTRAVLNSVREPARRFDSIEHSARRHTHLGRPETFRVWHLGWDASLGTIRVWFLGCLRYRRGILGQMCNTTLGWIASRLGYVLKVSHVSSPLPSLKTACG